MRTRASIAAAAVAACLAPAPAAAAVTATLASGDSAFWEGPTVAGAQVRDASMCDVAGPCLSYTLDVTAPHAKVLRVAIDSIDASNDWFLELVDPMGRAVASDESYQEAGLGERNDVELFAHDPAPGHWTVKVTPRDVVNGSFELRAAVDWVAPAPGCTVPALGGRTLAKARRLLADAGCRAGAITRPRHARASRLRVRRQKPAAGTVSTVPVRLALRLRSGRAPASGAHTRAAAAAAPAVHDVLPDLAPDPPWDLTFDQPTPQVGPIESGSPAAAVGVHNPTATAGGRPVIACLPEESAEQGATHCLRFSSGVASIGPGHFEVFGASTVPVATAGGPLYQVVGRSDGTARTVQAGQYTFHKVHLHYHVLALASFPLYRVQGDAMTPVGRGLKEGFCLGNIKLYDWHAFDAEPVDPNTVDNCEPDAGDPSAIAQLAPDAWRFYEGIATGWEDIYTWATSGQYVEMAGLPDGTYVLQMVINPEGHFLETDHRNDTAYTEFTIAGEDVRILERGRGLSPWDRHKVVLDPRYTRS